MNTALPKPEEGKTKPDMSAILRPSSVAVIGASATEGKWGNAILKGILKSGYQGKLYPVNPRVNEILGLRTYATVTQVEEPVELAMIGIRANLVPQAVS